MKLTFFLSLAALTLCTYGCFGNSKSEYTEKKEAAELEGQRCLAVAREALGDKNFEVARTAIENMRKDYPLALNAREEGILLLDSINLFEAESQLKSVNKMLRDSLHANVDSLQIEFDDLFQKSKFYKRKLEHDCRERKNH